VSQHWRTVPFIVTMALTCIISEIKQDIGQKLWILHTPFHLMLPLGGTLSEYCHNACYRKTRMVGLPDAKFFFEYMFSGVHRIPGHRCVTDGETDICDSIVHAMHVCRMVKSRSLYPFISKRHVKVQRMDHISVHKSCIIVSITVSYWRTRCGQSNYDYVEHHRCDNMVL